MVVGVQKLCYKIVTSLMDVPLRCIVIPYLDHPFCCTCQKNTGNIMIPSNVVDRSVVSWIGLQKSGNKNKIQNLMQKIFVIYSHLKKSLVVWDRCPHTHLKRSVVREAVLGPLTFFVRALIPNH